MTGGACDCDSNSYDLAGSGSSLTKTSTSITIRPTGPESPLRERTCMIWFELGGMGLAIALAAFDVFWPLTLVLAAGGLVLWAAGHIVLASVLIWLRPIWVASYFGL